MKTIKLQLISEELYKAYPCPSSWASVVTVSTYRSSVNELLYRLLLSDTHMVRAAAIPINNDAKSQCACMNYACKVRLCLI